MDIKGIMAINTLFKPIELNMPKYQNIVWAVKKERNPRKTKSNISFEVFRLTKLHKMAKRPTQKNKYMGVPNK